MGEKLQEAWRLMKEAEAAESSSGGGDEGGAGGGGGGDEAWQAKFVRAMNNLTAVDLRHQKGAGAGGPGSNASQVSVAESAAEKALDRLKVRGTLLSSPPVALWNIPLSHLRLACGWTRDNVSIEGLDRGSPLLNADGEPPGGGIACGSFGPVAWFQLLTI